MKVLRCMKCEAGASGCHCTVHVCCRNGDDLGIDTPLPNQVFHELQNLLRGQTLAIRAILRHRLKNVGDAQDSGFQIQTLCRQAEG